ncbi:MAG: hypothetical protein JWO30_865 [Fibrobacteres bacterium]|nr:hypothetical protein [Fibrobacterota bacterium]
MKNFFKNVDLDQVKDQIAEIKDQVQDMKFRTPWTRGSDTSPAAFMAIGAAAALLGVTLYRNRKEVAHFCSNCGADLMGKLESSGIKDKAGQILSKMKNGAQDIKAQATQERYQPT